jgi:hypothetical protein
MKRYIVIAILLSLVSLTGCGRKESHLSGTVTFQGKPVKSGEILLTPDDKRGNRGPGVLVEIKDGTFRTPTQRGHWGGAYLATISASKGNSMLFSNYEMQIDLPEEDTTYDFVIPDDAATQKP